MALTDHFVGLWDYPIVDTALFRSKGFTTLLGAELHSGAQSNGALWHILAVGLPLDFARPDGATGRTRSAGCAERTQDHCRRTCHR